MPITDIKFKGFDLSIEHDWYDSPGSVGQVGYIHSIKWIEHDTEIMPLLNAICTFTDWVEISELVKAAYIKQKEIDKISYDI